MTEQYFTLKFIQEYIVPLIIILLAVVFFLIGWAASRFSNKWEEREKKINDRLWKKIEEREGNERKQA